MRLTRRSALAASVAPLAGCLARDPASDDADPAGEPSTDEADAVRIGLLGDVMLGRSVDEYRSDRDPASVWGSTHDRLTDLDGLLCNLECVISDRGEPWPDKTYHFRADPDWAFDALTAAGIDVCSLANNHALDYGAPALLDTIEGLDAAGIAATGAGEHRDAAMGPAVVEVGGLTVAVVGFVDHWGAFAAGPDDPGTVYVPRPVDDPAALETADALVERALEADPDLVVASLHWGGNWERYPEPAHERTARWLIDRGADVVYGHSAHVIQGIEVYRGRPIVYDAGDFVNDYALHEDFRNDRGFLYELVVEDGPAALRLVPVEIDEYAPHVAEGEAREWLHEAVRERSAAYDTAFEDDSEGPGLRVPIEE